MKFRQVNDQLADWLAARPETFMGLQILAQAEMPRDEFIFILGSEIAVEFGEGEDGTGDLLKQPWYGRMPPFEGAAGAEAQGERRESYTAWRNQLPVINVAPGANLRILPRSAYLLHLWSILPAPPPVPPQLYGHLPFTGQTQGGDVFYRWEPWPVSRRINQLSGTVSPGTYAAPRSEMQFAPTGFSAVGRFALPNLAPACFRWELKPVAKRAFRCGASVPLYGQAGGGVEVFFARAFKNVGPIANPVPLPPL